MVIMVRKESFHFFELLEEEEDVEEDDNEGFSMFSFEEGGYNKFLQEEPSDRVAHMMSKMEDTTKHVHLLNDLKHHINKLY